MKNPSPSDRFERALEQYKLLSTLEQETTRMRHTMFTALVSVSFLLPGLAFKGADGHDLFTEGLTASKVIFLGGYLFYLFAVFHYGWYHRYSHRYRARLKELEVELGFEVYQLRKRPRVGPMKLHFDWVLYIFAVLYGIAAGSIAGWELVLFVLAVILVVYLALMLYSILQEEEPLEQ